MRWAVEIQKTSLEKRNLCDLLSGLGFELVRGIEFPALFSPEIDTCATAEEVFEMAKAVRAAFRDPAQIDPEFALGSVVDYSSDPPTRHAFLEVDSLVHNHSIFFPHTLTVSPPDGLSEGELKRWNLEQEELRYQAVLERQRAKLEPAYFSTSAAKVMELLSADEPTAEKLYKAYELIEEHAGGRRAFHQEFGISDSQFDCFRDAVHNPEVTGDWARHAVPDKPRTPNPMDRRAAIAFVRDIADKWLNTLRRRS